MYNCTYTTYIWIELLNLLLAGNGICHRRRNRGGLGQPCHQPRVCHGRSTAGPSRHHSHEGCQGKTGPQSWPRLKEQTVSILQLLHHLLHHVSKPKSFILFIILLELHAFFSNYLSMILTWKRKPWPLFQSSQMSPSKYLLSFYYQSSIEYELLKLVTFIKENIGNRNEIEIYGYSTIWLPLLIYFMW